MRFFKWLFGSSDADNSNNTVPHQGDYYDDMKINEPWRYYGIKHDQRHRR